MLKTIITYYLYWTLGALFKNLLSFFINRKDRKLNPVDHFSWYYMILISFFSILYLVKDFCDLLGVLIFWLDARLLYMDYTTENVPDAVIQVNKDADQLLKNAWRYKFGKKDNI